jgi:ABC-2 type transport system ATP-binding protein
LFVITVEQLTKRYAGITAIDRLSFEVAKGEIVGLLGPSGAGKTTTLRILSGYLPASSGRATVAGFDIFRDSVKARSQLGYLPEQAPLYQEMRVDEYLAFRAALKGLTRTQQKLRIGAVKEFCRLGEIGRRLISGLSRGFRQRVALADAIIHEPQVLILDEPWAGLDPGQIRNLHELIKTLARDQTVLLASHLLSEVESICSRVIILDRGHIEAADTPGNLVRQLRTSRVIRLEVKTGAERPEDFLRHLSGVKEISVTPEDGWLQCSIRMEADTDLRLQIYQLAASRKWMLRELSGGRASLEDVLVELTQEDA